MLVYNEEMNSPFRRGHKWHGSRRQKCNEIHWNELFQFIVSCCIAGAAWVKWKSFFRSERDFVSPKQSALHRRPLLVLPLHVIDVHRENWLSTWWHCPNALQHTWFTAITQFNGILNEIQWSSQCDFDTSTSSDNSSSNKLSLFTIRSNHMLHYAFGDNTIGC